MKYLECAQADGSYLITGLIRLSITWLAVEERCLISKSLDFYGLYEETDLKWSWNVPFYTLEKCLLRRRDVSYNMLWLTEKSKVKST